MKYCFFAVLLVIALASCNYSKYPIDEKPTIKFDSRLVGIWKAIEDTSISNFILVQTTDDVILRVDDLISQYGSIQGYIEDMKKRSGDDAFEYDSAQLVTMLKEIENEKQEFKHYYYYLTYFNGEGKNPLYQQWGSILSRIEKSLFLTTKYRYVPIDADGHFLHKGNEQGYLLIKFIRINAAYDTITTALVSDPYLKTAKNSAEVRSRVTKNLNSKSYYSDTVHFYKVKGGHFGLNEAMKLAN